MFVVGTELPWCLLAGCLQEPSSSAPPAARGKDGHITLNAGSGTGGDFFGNSSRPARGAASSGGGAPPAHVAAKSSEVSRGFGRVFCAYSHGLGSSRWAQ